MFPRNVLEPALTSWLAKTHGAGIPIPVALQDAIYLKVADLAVRRGRARLSAAPGHISVN
ncbi:MAG TPA: hypothetical protein VIO57_09170 [Chloroflexota bacterium]